MSSRATPPVTHLPRIVSVLAGVGLLIAVNNRAPGVIQGVLFLVVLYALLVNVPRAVALIQTPSRTLARGFGYAPDERRGGK